MLCKVMQKLGFSLLFFSLCFATVSYGQENAQHSHGLPEFDRLFASLNIDSIMHRVNVDSIMHSVNIDSIMRRVNIDSIMRRVNIDSLLHRVNIDSLIGRFNLDSLWKANRSKIGGYLKADRSPAHASRQNYASVMITNNSFADSLMKHPLSLTVTNGPRGFSLHSDTIYGKHELTPKELKQFLTLPNGSGYYFAHNGQRYYMNIVPPAQRGTRIDSSYVWLLGSR